MAKSRQIILLLAIVILAVAIQAQEQCNGKNQQFTTCGSACPPKCNDDPSKPCTLQCIVGCQCKPGFLLNSNNECVTPQEC